MLIMINIKCNVKCFFKIFKVFNPGLTRQNTKSKTRLGFSMTKLYPSVFHENLALLIKNISITGILEEIGLAFHKRS